MVRCSYCGCEADNPEKVWSVTLGKVKRTRITFAAFCCSNCHRKFKLSIKKENLPRKEEKHITPPIYMTMIV